MPVPVPCPIALLLKVDILDDITTLIFTSPKFIAVMFVTCFCHDGYVLVAEPTNSVTVLSVKPLTALLELLLGSSALVGPINLLLVITAGGSDGGPQGITCMASMGSHVN